MSNFESRPPTSSGFGCSLWFGTVVAFPLIALALIDKLKLDHGLVLGVLPVGFLLTLVSSVVLARVLQLDSETKSPVLLSLGLFIGGMFLSVAVFFFGCSNMDLGL